MEYYDKSYDRVTTKNEKKLKRIDRIFHKVTTTDDPIIRGVNMTVDNINSEVLCTLVTSQSTF